TEGPRKDPGKEAPYLLSPLLRACRSRKRTPLGQKGGMNPLRFVTVTVLAAALFMGNTLTRAEPGEIAPAEIDGNSSATVSPYCDITPENDVAPRGIWERLRTRMLPRAGGRKIARHQPVLLPCGDIQFVGDLSYGPDKCHRLDMYLPSLPGFPVVLY